MSIPAVAKIGVGSTLAIGAPTSIYLAWDHITLYAVEREVISKDLKLIIEDLSSDNPKKIKIKVPLSTDTGSNLKLEAGNSWSCVITIQQPSENGETTIDATNLISKLKAKFPDNGGSTIDDTTRKNKEILVRACSKRRTKENLGNNSVEGNLNIKEKFEENPELNFLLENN